MLFHWDLKGGSGGGSLLRSAASFLNLMFVRFLALFYTDQEINYGFKGCFDREKLANTVITKSLPL